MQVVDASVDFLEALVDVLGVPVGVLEVLVGVFKPSAQKVPLEQDESSDHKNGRDDEPRVARQSLRWSGLSRRCGGIATGSLPNHAHGHIVAVPSLWRTWAGPSWLAVIQLPASLRRNSIEAEFQSARLGSSGPHAVQFPLERTSTLPRSGGRRFGNSATKRRVVPLGRPGPLLDLDTARTGHGHVDAIKFTDCAA